MSGGRKCNGRRERGLQLLLEQGAVRTLAKWVAGLDDYPSGRTKGVYDDADELETRSAKQ